MQNRKLYIGITGGIGSGKSAVTNILINKGYPVIDADLIARQVMAVGHSCYNEVQRVFGTSFFKPSGELDRQKLAELIFNDESKRTLLNQIVHPAIYKEILDARKKYEMTHDIIFADIPLLIENGRMEDFDGIWLVYTDLTVRIDRIVRRDQVDEDYAKAKIASQMSLEEKKKYATEILENNGTLEMLEKIVTALLLKIKL